MSLALYRHVSLLVLCSPLASVRGLWSITRAINNGSQQVSLISLRNTAAEHT